jgi:fumarate reductase subunit D
MPLSKKDQEFYEEKLGWKSFGILFAATTVVGALLVPIVLYIQDSSNGQTGNWSKNLVINLVVEGFLLGSVVSVVMYLAFKFLLSMGWLPSRH